MQKWGVRTWTRRQWAQPPTPQACAPPGGAARRPARPSLQPLSAQPPGAAPLEKIGGEERAQTAMFCVRVPLWLWGCGVVNEKEGCTLIGGAAVAAQRTHESPSMSTHASCPCSCLYMYAQGSGAEGGILTCARAQIKCAARHRRIRRHAHDRTHGELPSEPCSLAPPGIAPTYLGVSASPSGKSTPPQPDLIKLRMLPWSSPSGFSSTSLR